ncbi:MAG: hypothetical protein ACR2P0_13910 [Acidimicrobiales bacterium]
MKTVTAPTSDLTGAALGGLGGGVETTRSYLAQDFASGSKQSVMRWLKTIIERGDVQRVWLRAMGTKDILWSHEGPLRDLPDLDVLFESTGDIEIADEILDAA